jgi:hypothetical protein
MTTVCTENPIREKNFKGNILIQADSVIRHSEIHDWDDTFELWASLSDMPWAVLGDVAGLYDEHDEFMSSVSPQEYDAAENGQRAESSLEKRCLCVEIIAGEARNHWDTYDIRAQIHGETMSDGLLGGGNTNPSAIKVFAPGKTSERGFYKDLRSQRYRDTFNQSIKGTGPVKNTLCMEVNNDANIESPVQIAVGIDEFEPRHISSIPSKLSCEIGHDYCGRMTVIKIFNLNGSKEPIPENTNPPLTSWLIKRRLEDRCRTGYKDIAVR